MSIGAYFYFFICSYNGTSPCSSCYFNYTSPTSYKTSITNAAKVSEANNGKCGKRRRTNRGNARRASRSSYDWFTSLEPSFFVRFTLFSWLAYLVRLVCYALALIARCAAARTNYCITTLPLCVRSRASKSSRRNLSTEFWIATLALKCTWSKYRANSLPLLPNLFYTSRKWIAPLLARDNINVDKAETTYIWNMRGISLKNVIPLRLSLSSISIISAGTCVSFTMAFVLLL